MASRLYAQLAFSHWRERLQAALTTGWGVEVQLDDSGCFMPPGGPSQARPEEGLEQVRALAEALGARPRLAHLPNYGVQLGCKDRTIGETSLAVALQAVRAAAALGCDRAVYHTYLLPTLPSHKLAGWLPTFLGRFENLLAESERLGVRLLVENVWEKDGALFDELFSRFGDRIGMCLDVGHAHCFSPHAFAWWWQRFADRVEHAHVSDNDGSEDAHLPPGEGTIPWSEVWPVLWGEQGLTITFEMAAREAPEAFARLERIIGDAPSPLPGGGVTG